MIGPLLDSSVSNRCHFPRRRTGACLSATSGDTTNNINVVSFGLHIYAAGPCDSEYNCIEAVVAVIIRWVLQSAGLSVPEIP